MTVSKTKLKGRSMIGYRGGATPNFRGQLSSPTVTFQFNLVPLKIMGRSGSNVDKVRNVAQPPSGSDVVKSKHK